MLAIQLKQAFDHKLAFALPYVLGVHAIEGTFGKAQVVNGIQYIGFAHPILSQEEVYLAVESKVCPFIIFKVEKCELF